MATINTASSYVVNFTDSIHRAPIIIHNSNINTSTSLSLVGPNYRNYGQLIAENSLHLLENFANTVAPYPPVKGQLWYDTTGSGKLKINITGSASDWIPANGIYQQGNAPTTSSSGDIWVDTNSRQLFIYSGSEWLLIGPQFSSGLMTGPRAETIIDTNGTSHLVIKNYVNGDVITILTKASFTPALVINGFNTLVPGINLTRTAFKGTYARMNGVSTSAEALQITPTLTIAADQFVRRDAAAQDQIMLTDLTFSSGKSLKFGDVSEPVLRIMQSAQAEVAISNYQSNGRFVFKVIDETGTVKPAVVIQGQPTGTRHRVGINVTAPLYELHVNGSMYVTTATISGLSVIGPINVTGQAVFNGTPTFTSNIITHNITPITAGNANIGSSVLPYNKVYANSFEGAASKLTYPSRFKLNGQFTSNNITTASLFVGDGTDLAIEGQLAVGAITDQPLWSTPVTNTASIIISIPSTIAGPEAALYKVSKRTFLQDVVPPGTVMLWGGVNAPAGWLSCDGSNVPVALYPDLYEAIGTTYGIVSVGQFSLPTLPVVNSPSAPGRYNHDLYYIIKY